MSPVLFSPVTLKQVFTKQHKLALNLICSRNKSLKPLPKLPRQHTGKVLECRGDPGLTTELLKGITQREVESERDWNTL